MDDTPKAPDRLGLTIGGRLRFHPAAGGAPGQGRQQAAAQRPWPATGTETPEAIDSDRAAGGLATGQAVQVPRAMDGARVRAGNQVAGIPYRAHNPGRVWLESFLQLPTMNMPLYCRYTPTPQNIKPA